LIDPRKPPGGDDLGTDHDDLAERFRDEAFISWCDGPVCSLNAVKPTARRSASSISDTRSAAPGGRGRSSPTAPRTAREQSGTLGEGPRGPSRGRLYGSSVGVIGTESAAPFHLPLSRPSACKRRPAPPVPPARTGPEPQRRQVPDMATVLGCADRGGPVRRRPGRAHPGRIACALVCRSVS
jgi:hypothetical protein